MMEIDELRRGGRQAEAGRECEVAVWVGRLGLVVEVSGTVGFKEGDLLRSVKGWGWEGCEVFVERGIHVHVHEQGLLFMGSVKLSCGGRTEFWCGKGTGYRRWGWGDWKLLWCVE